jgi:hypothetical protein
MFKLILSTIVLILQILLIIGGMYMYIIHGLKDPEFIVVLLFMLLAFQKSK